MIVIYYSMRIASEILPNQNHNLETGGFHCSNKKHTHNGYFHPLHKNLDLFKVIYFVPRDSSPFFSTILRRIFLGHTLRSIQSQIPKNTSTYSTRYFPPPYLYQICSARYQNHQKHILCFTHRRYVPPQTGHPEERILRAPSSHFFSSD